MLKKYTCIVCPNGCEIQVDLKEEGAIEQITGNQCPKGEEYVFQEIKNPVRTVTTSVAVRHGELPLVSVRLTKPVSRNLISQVMSDVKEIFLDAPVKEGDVIVSKILGTDSDLIATKTVNKI